MPPIEIFQPPAATAHARHVEPTPGAVRPARALLAGLLGVLLAHAAAPARAERADHDKPTLIDAGHQSLDDLNQVSVFTGGVVVTKGTLKLTGERVDYREDPEGYQYAIVTVPEGKRATFRERRDPSQPGVEEIIAGEADRIEYDGKAGTVRLIANAVVRRFENGAQRDEMNGGLIVYDGNNSTYDVRADAGAGAPAGAAPGGRVRSVIAPRLPLAPAAPVPLAPTVPTAPPAPAAPAAPAAPSESNAAHEVPR
jgi:lipopolysaccharide export system protein LptA